MLHPSDVEFPSGYFATLEFVRSTPPEVVAAAVHLSVDDYLEHLERWSEGPGFTYGIRVDREARTVTQAGAGRRG